MTAYFDTSAVLALHLETAARTVAVAALESVTCTSALALTEALALIDKLTDEALLRADIEDEVRRQWDRYHIVPVDQRCLDRAAVLMREQPLRLADSLHLAAADRLPRPLRYVTFDPAQIPVALSLGFDVVSL
ncbi:MAG: PIN domain-containing protein [Ilumatobacteraceae bacterium]